LSSEAEAVVEKKMAQEKKRHQAVKRSVERESLPLKGKSDLEEPEVGVWGF
jgi:hypothetical protein